MAKSNKITYREAPLGLDPMPTKQSTTLPASTGPLGKAVPGGAPDGNIRPDGTGGMSMHSEDPGNDAKRNDIGRTVPSGRHGNKPL